MSDPNYIKKQATRMQSATHPKAKEDAGWRILSNSDGATRWLVKTALKQV